MSTVKVSRTERDTGIPAIQILSKVTRTTVREGGRCFRNLDTVKKRG